MQFPKFSAKPLAVRGIFVIFALAIRKAPAMDIHPLEKFRYCPVCGSKHFEENGPKSKRCDNCGFEYYQNPSSAVAAFITNSRGELLVERRGKEPAKGMLDLPGGFCDAAETAEEAIAREIKEETGLDAKVEGYMFSQPNVYLYAGMNIHTLDLFYRCTVPGNETPVAADDAAEAFWLPIADVHTEQFGLRSIRYALRQFLDTFKNA